MKSLAWNLSPQEFANKLLDMKRMWRRSAGGSSKRRVADLVRKRSARYRRFFGYGKLPLASRETAIDWIEAPPESVKVVIIPDGETASYSKTRKDARRLLRKAFPKRDDAIVELISSRNADASSRKPPAVATAQMGRRTVARAVLLETFGAVICPGLTPEKERLLRQAGAQVFDNELLSLERTSPSQGAKASDIWHLGAMNVFSARATGLSGRGVLIGIADTGIEPSHPEFSGKKVYFRSFTPSGRRRRDAVVRDFADHGTKVAALSAGRNCGVAPSAQIAVAAIFTKQGDGKMRASSAQILTGLNWLARGGHGLPRPVDVINVSWGKEAETKGLYDVIRRHSLAGILTIAAIGNDGVDGENRHHCPAKFDIVLGVGAVDKNGATCKFSSWGRVHNLQDGWKPELVAPGEDIICAQPRGEDSKNGYVYDNGTSLASSLVTGSAALLIEKFPKVRGDAQALKEKLLKLTNGLGGRETIRPDRRRGAGSLDLSGI
ncbi:S8 family peptidase [Bradyrhizobium brasilense]|uniref:S8 family serine peptidase n=1 Tax=Bradyrhizobium brasilense TaxID=1419277 RepID=A0ABY8JCN4_9BRAD|nr:S8 family serine peptidase [Bradyrhizobium brasilense]WFU62479.1 S8 family serine peptidase [Bradyrhizobium brasilense]